MPIIKSAKKKLRQDHKRAKANARYLLAYKKAFKNLKKQPNIKTLKIVYTQIDKALKKNIFHKNKANRLKAQAAKLVRSFSLKKQVKSN